MNQINIRAAHREDAKALLEIYAPYVEQTAITFEYEVPDVAEFERRIEMTLERYPYLVAEVAGEPMGYAYASSFKSRAAYDWAVETSIYVNQNAKRTGIGKALYQELESILQKQNITNVNACIAVPNGADDEYLTRNSVDFHAHMGYKIVGEFHQCGSKFGRWYNMVWMEKMIATHPEPPMPFIPYPNVRL